MLNTKLCIHLTQLSSIYLTHLWQHSDHTFTVMSISIFTMLINIEEMSTKMKNEGLETNNDENAREMELIMMKMHKDQMNQVM